MRARLAIVAAGLNVELREVELRNKPAELFTASPKATVPVLVLPNGDVIDESLDIMAWALSASDPNGWLDQPLSSDNSHLIAYNDGEFKHFLDRYKYADRYPEQTAEDYRRHGESFLQHLENRLRHSPFLAGSGFGFVDAAIAPFVRQFAAVDTAWFATANYPNLRRWLHRFLASLPFEIVMQTYQPWSASNSPLIFPCNPQAL